MSKSMKFDRRTMRKMAVDCIFAYDFVLEEERNRDTTPIEEPVKPVRRSSTMILNKPLARGRRKIKVRREEFEARQKQLEELIAETQNENTANIPAEPAEFDVDNFIVDVCSSAGAIGDGEFDDDKFRASPEYENYLQPVVSTVIENIDAIDQLIAKNSTGWDLERIKKTDLAILRVAVCELKFLGDKVPLQVAVNEAVEMAKADDPKAGPFVNGVLAGVIKEQ